MLFAFPLYQIAPIFNQWLTIREVCRVDSAVCNIKIRATFLKIVASPVLSVNGARTKALKLAFLWWSCARDVKLSSVYIDGSLIGIGKNPSFLEFHAHVNKFESKLKMIKVDNYNVETCALFHSYLMQHSNIETVTFNHSGDVNFQFISQTIKLCKKLTSCDLSFCYNVTDDCILSICKNNVDLQALFLQENKITIKSIESLMTFCPHITTLHLSNCTHIDDDCMDLITSSYPLLRSLDITWCFRVTGGGLRKLVNCSQLTQLHMANLYIESTVECIPTIAQSCMQLTDFNIAKWTLSKDHILDLVKSCSLLRKLDFSYIGTVNAEVIETIASNCTELTHLNVANSRSITCAMMIKLVKSCTKLEFLDVERLSSITSSVVFNVELCLHCPKLTELNYSYCEDVSKQCVVLLLSSLKQLRKLKLHNNFGLFDGFEYRKRNTHHEYNRIIEDDY